MKSFDELTKTIAELEANFPAIQDTKNIYVNELMWQRILIEIPNFILGQSMDKGTIYSFLPGAKLAYMGIIVHSDNDVPDDTFIHSTAADFAIYKELCKHSWLDIKTMPDKEIAILIELAKGLKKEHPVMLIPSEPMEYERPRFAPFFRFQKDIDSDLSIPY